MSNWDTLVAGDEQDLNKYLDFRQYDTIAERDAVSVAFGSAELFHICRVVETGYYYYWNGAVWSAFPTTGGAGAPTSASYVTINAEAALSSETLHKNIVGANLHITKAHASEHENAGADEINVAGLSGVLADDQDADHIKGVEVDDSAKADTFILQYQSGDGKLHYIAAPGGGDMLQASYDTTATGNKVDTALNAEKLGTKLPAFYALADHDATHATGGMDAFDSSDLLDAIARVTVRKNTGANVGSRRRLNFIEGTGISLTVTDVAGSEEVTVRIDGAGTGLGGTWSTGTCTGRSPIVTPHSLGGTPTLVLFSINAVQPYVASYNADATNLTFYHNAAGSLTIKFAARL